MQEEVKPYLYKKVCHEFDPSKIEVGSLITVEFIANKELDLKDIRNGIVTNVTPNYIQFVYLSPITGKIETQKLTAEEAASHFVRYKIQKVLDLGSR